VCKGLKRGEVDIIDEEKNANFFSVKNVNKKFYRKNSKVFLTSFGRLGKSLPGFTLLK
jgi:hypothetical protein